MKKSLICIAMLFSIISLDAQEKAPVKVLLLGTFHFDNPGLDVAKFQNANILSVRRQKEVGQVVKALKAFAPDKIFIEATTERQKEIDSLFSGFKSGTTALKASEVYQLGFRLAKELHLSSVNAVDYQNAEFPFDSLMKSAAEAGQKNITSFVQKIIDSVQKSFNEALQVSTVTEMLLRENSPAAMRLQLEFYFHLLPAGDFGNHIGPYLVSEWWRRNMVICENILKSLTGNEKRILIIFGSGHTAILNEMLKFNSNFELVPVQEVLRPQ